MKPDDVYRFAAAGDPRVSPDGRTIAFVVSTVDAETHEPRSAVWSVSADGSADPRRLTFGGDRDANPRWSPDGRWLAFTSGRGDDPAQLFVLPVDGPGESRRLTSLPEAVEYPAWSPDGERIVFQARAHDPGDDVEEASRRPPRRITRLQYRLDHEGWTEGREHHLHVVGLDGEPPTQLTDGPFDDQMPSWSPDGGSIAFVSARDDDWDLQPTNRLYTISSSGGTPEQLGSEVGAFLAPVWSPEGDRIACVFVPGAFDDPRHGRIAVVDAATGALTRLTDDLDRNAAPFPMMRGPMWDGDRILFPAEDQGRVPVFSVRARGEAPPAVELDADGYLTGFDVAGGTFAYTASTPTRFAEVFVGERRLSNIGATFTDEVTLVGPEPFTAVSADGTEVPAWVLRPPGFDPDETYPAVLNIHGGPYTQYGDRFFDEFQMYAAAGYVVLYANPRGSSGYDESWGRAIRGPVEGGPGWGSVDYDDLMAVADEALKRFAFIDADRLGVMGGSYGGYMTSWIVGHTDRFACAISERAVNDMASEDGSADIAGFFRGYVGADFWDDPEAYRRISPITYATQMTTPLLILHSEDDLRCPINQGEQLFTVLRSLRREVEFVRFPAESHELTRSGSPTHRVQRFEIVLEWLDRHLKR